MVAVTPGRFGRMPPPPPGKIWVRNQRVAWELSIIAAVERFTAVGELVPQHLERLACTIGPDTPQTAFELADSDFGIPLEPFASAQPLTDAAGEAPPEQPSLWDEEEAAGVDLEGWTVPELKDALAQLGVDYPASARKAELIALLQEAEE